MWVRILAICLALAALGAAARRYAQPSEPSGQAAAEEARTKILSVRGDWVPVSRGDFEIAVQEDGELKPVKVTSLTFLIPGKVAYMMPEGSEAHKGDRVVALETKDLEDDMQHTREDLDTAETNLALQIQTRDLEIKRMETELRTEAEKVDFAALKDREIAAHPDVVEKEDAKNTLDVAKSHLESAEGDLKLAQPLFDKGYQSKQDYEVKVIAVTKSKLEMTRADMKARIILTGALEDDRIAAHLDLEFALRGYKFKQIDNSDQIYSLDAKVKSAERAVASLKRKLAKREVEFERSTLHAPHDGIVVYRTMGYRNNKKPELGERVSPWIAPIDLPNYEHMKVRTQVPESLIRMISARGPAEDGGKPLEGSKARVEINTLPGVIYGAHVTWIDGWARDRNSKLSDADIKAQGLSGVKVFDVEVELDDSDPKHLREGFRARVDFPEETLKNTFAIPEQAVSTIDGISTVMVMDGSSPVARKVELGRSSLGKVAVLSGLNNGDKIYVPKIVQPNANEDENNASKPNQKGGKPGDKKAPPNGNAPSIKAGADRPDKRAGGVSDERQWGRHSCPPAPAANNVCPTTIFASNEMGRL